MPDWSQIGSFMDFCAAYYTTQLVRCAAFSLLLVGIVMLLRKIFFSGRTFLKGLLWLLFLLVPYLGRLKLFYENKAVLRITWWLTQGTMTCLWVDRIYMAVIFIATIMQLRQVQMWIYRYRKAVMPFINASGKEGLFR